MILFYINKQTKAQTFKMQCIEEVTACFINANPKTSRGTTTKVKDVHTNIEINLS